MTDEDIATLRVLDANAVRLARTLAVKGSYSPKTRPLLLEVLRPWWCSAKVGELADWIEEWDLREVLYRRPRGSRSARLACLLARCVPMEGQLAERLQKLEAQAFGELPWEVYPINRCAQVSDREAIIEYLELLVLPHMHTKLLEPLTHFVRWASGLDLAPLIRAAIPLEELIP